MSREQEQSAHTKNCFVTTIGAGSNNLADDLERLANLIDVVGDAILSDVQEDQIE